MNRGFISALFALPILTSTVTIDNVGSLSISDANVTVNVDYEKPLLSTLTVTSVHSLNAKFKECPYNPRADELPIQLSDYIGQDGFGLVYSGLFDIEQQEKESTIDYVGKSDTYKRAINVLGGDILLDSEVAKSKSEYEKVDTVLTALPLDSLLQDTYKALGQYIYDYTVFYSPTPKFDLGKSVLQKDLHLQLKENDPLNLIRGRCDFFVSRTNKDAYWEKAVSDDILYSDETKDTVTTFARYCALLQKLMYIYGEPVMTEQEQYYLLQAYGKDIPYFLDNAEELEAVKYLIAKGILAPEEVTKYTGPVDMELLLTMLTRVADKESRLTFKDIQLTMDVGLLSKGYYPIEVAASDIEVSAAEVEYVKADYFDFMLPVDSTIWPKDSNGGLVSYNKIGLCTVSYDPITRKPVPGYLDESLVVYRGKAIHNDQLYVRFSVKSAYICDAVYDDPNGAYPFAQFNSTYVTRSLMDKEDSMRYLMFGAEVNGEIRYFKVKVGNSANASINDSSVIENLTGERGKLLAGGWYGISENKKNFIVDSSKAFVDATYQDSRNIEKDNDISSEDYTLRVKVENYNSDLFGEPGQLYISYIGYTTSYRRDALQTDGVVYLGETEVDGVRYYEYTLKSEAVNSYMYALSTDAVYIVVCTPMSYAKDVVNGYGTINIQTANSDRVIYVDELKPEVLQVSSLELHHLNTDYECSLGIVLRSKDKKCRVETLLKTAEIDGHTLYDIVGWGNNTKSGSVTLDGKTVNVSIASTSYSADKSTTIRLTISGHISKEVFRENFRIDEKSGNGYTAYPAFAKNGSRILANLDWLKDVGYVERVTELSKDVLAVYTATNAIYLKKTDTGGMLILGSVIYEVSDGVVLWEKINDSIYIDYAATLGWLGNYVTYTNINGQVVPSFDTDRIDYRYATMSCINIADKTVSSEIQVKDRNSKEILLSGSYQFSNYFLYCADPTGNAGVDEDVLFVFKPICSANKNYDDSQAKLALSQLLGGQLPTDQNNEDYWRVYYYPLSRTDSKVNPPRITYDAKYGYVYTPPVVDLKPDIDFSTITIDGVHDLDLDADAIKLTNRYIKSHSSKHPLVLPFVTFKSSTYQCNPSVDKTTHTIRYNAKRYKIDAIYDLNCNTFRVSKKTYLPYMYAPLCSITKKNYLYCTTYTKSGTKYIESTNRVVELGGVKQATNRLYASQFVPPTSSLLLETSVIESSRVPKDKKYYLLGGTRYYQSTHDLSAVTEIAAPVGVVSQIIGVGKYSWADISDTFAKVFYGTHKLERIITGTGVSLTTGDKTIAYSSVDNADLTFCLLQRTGSAISYSVNAIGLESTFEALQASDVVSGQAATMHRGLSFRFEIDWDKYKFNQLIDSYDTLTSLILILALTILPRLASFGFITMLALSFIADAPPWQRFCDKFIDPYKALSLGRQNVHTVRQGMSFYYMLIGEAFIGMFTDGNIIHFFNWLAQAAAQFTTY